MDCRASWSRAVRRGGAVLRQHRGVGIGHRGGDRCRRAWAMLVRRTTVAAVHMLSNAVERWTRRRLQSAGSTAVGALCHRGTLLQGVGPDARNPACRHRLRRACSALSQLAANPPTAVVGAAADAADVAMLLAASAADLEAAKARAAALPAEPAGLAGAGTMPGDAVSAGQPAEVLSSAEGPGPQDDAAAAVDPQGTAIPSATTQPPSAMPMEEDAPAPAADARLVIGADAVALAAGSPAAVKTAEPEGGAAPNAAAVVVSATTIEAVAGDPSPPESPAAADKENTPPGKRQVSGSPQGKEGSLAAGGSTAAAIVAQDATVAIVGSTSCSPEKAGPAGRKFMGTPTGQSGAGAVGGGAANAAPPPDASSEAVDGDGAKAGDRRSPFIPMNVFCNPLYSTA